MNWLLEPIKRDIYDHSVVCLEVIEALKSTFQEDFSHLHRRTHNLNELYHYLQDSSLYPVLSKLEDQVAGAPRDWKTLYDVIFLYYFFFATYAVTCKLLHLLEITLRCLKSQKHLYFPTSKLYDPTRGWLCLCSSFARAAAVLLTAVAGLT